MEVQYSTALIGSTPRASARARVTGRMPREPKCCVEAISATGTKGNDRSQQRPHRFVGQPCKFASIIRAAHTV